MFVVGDLDDCCAELGVYPRKQLHYPLGIDGIQVARRLVEEDDLGTEDESARDRNALLFAARKFARHGCALVRKPHKREQIVKLFLHRAFSFAVQEHGHEDVLLHVEIGREVEELEDKAYLGAPEDGAAFLLCGGDVLAVHQHFAGGGRLDASQDGEQRGLAAPGRAEDGQELSAFHIEVDVVEDDVAAVVGVGDSSCLDDRHDDFPSQKTSFRLYLFLRRISRNTFIFLVQKTRGRRADARRARKRCHDLCRKSGKIY